MLDPKEEAKFAELKDKCRELKVPAPPEIMIGLKVHEGGVLTFDDVQRGHSWTRNFYNFTLQNAGGVALGDGSLGAGSSAIRVIDGTWDSSFTATAFAYTFGITDVTKGYRGASGCPHIGIMVGTSDTAFNPNHYTLQALCAEGTGEGQLSYTANSAPSRAYTAGTKTWKITMSRIINNNSGGSITVKETGIAPSLGFGGGTGQTTRYSALMERSVLSPTVAVANGAQLTVTYEISMDFSAID